jgi:hypothetical protein
VYPRVYSHLSGYRVSGPSYFPIEPRDEWNGKSTFPNLKILSSDDGTVKSSKPRDRPDLSPRSKSDPTLTRYPINIGRGYLDGFGPYETYPSFPSRPTTRKWSNDDLENYFSQMRISPRGRDAVPKDMVHRQSTSVNLVRPTPVRPEGFASFDHDSPVTSPNETDDSLSGESLGTSSGNTLISVNGSVGVNVPERNKVMLERIRRGLDTRTTIMVKNVPNKYTQVLTF